METLVKSVGLWHHIGYYNVLSSVFDEKIELHKKLATRNGSVFKEIHGRNWVYYWIILCSCLCFVCVTEEFSINLFVLINSLMTVTVII